MTNEQMRPNRYGRWAEARRMVRDIQHALRTGHTVVIATHLKAWQCSTPECADMFYATRTGAFVQRGTKRTCIDYCSIRFYA